MGLTVEQSSQRLAHYKQLIDRAWTKERLREIENMERYKKPEHALNDNDKINFVKYVAQRREDFRS